MRPPSRRAFVGASEDESGFSLLEVLIAMVLVGILGAALVAALSTALHIAGTSTQKVQESNDAELIAAFLARDAQAAGGSDPVTASVDPTTGVSTVDDGGCVPTGDLVVRFSWDDRRAGAGPVRRVVSYGLDPTTDELVRHACVDGAASGDAVLGHEVATATATCTPTCPGLPDSVSLAVVATNDLANAPTPFTYTLHASIRAQDQADPTPSTARTVAFVALGGAPSCTEGVTGLSIDGTSAVHVVGDVIVGAADVGPCAALEVGSGSTLHLDGGTTSVRGTCSGPGCDGANRLASAVDDPFATLVPPHATCSGPNPAPNAGTFVPGTYPEALVVTDTVAFSAGEYTFCHGITIGAHATVTGDGVSFYVLGGTFAVEEQASVTLSAPTSGARVGLLVWVASTATSSIDGGATVNTYDGLLYAPTATVRFAGGEGAQIEAIVARTIEFVASAGRVGPIPVIDVGAPADLASGRAGDAYASTPFSATGGTPPHTWTAAGLPAGLRMSRAGTISGTPSASGTYTVTVSAHDASTAVGHRTYAITVDPAADLAVTAPTLLPDWTVGRAYPASSSASTGGVAPYTWTAVLPPGLAIDPVSGVIAGSPTTAGTFAVTVTVADSTTPDPISATHSYTMTIQAAPALAVATPTKAVVGRAYSWTPPVTGGNRPLTWSSGVRPVGLVLNPGTGEISGTPTAAGTPTVTVTVVDASGATATRAYVITILAPPVVSAPSTLPSRTVGRPYPTTTFTATGSSGGYTWSATGLPTGLTVSPAGVLTGTPTAAGASTVTVTVVSGTGVATSRNYPLTVNAVPTATGPVAMVPWTVGRAYPSTATTVTGGTTPFAYTATSLPTGMVVSATTGAVSGTPTAAGTWTVTVTATDASGAVASRTNQVVINGAPTMTAPDALVTWTAGRAYPATTVTSTGGTAPIRYTAVTLPTGMALNVTTGVISGTPTLVGTRSVVVTATDAAGAPSSRTLSITINAAEAIASTPAWPAWTVNAPYPTISPTATGGTLPRTWSVTNLTPGLSIDTGTGVLSGTPTEVGTRTIVLTVTDAVGATASRSYSVKISAAGAITAPATLPNRTVGRAYTSTTLTGTGGTGTAVWSATGLPTGMVIGTTGVISGTPTATGPVSVTVTRTDAVGATATRTYTFTINAAPAVRTPIALPASTAFTGVAIVTAGTQNYTYVLTGAPSFVTFGAGGTISGTPPAGPRSYTFTVQATDSSGSVAGPTSVTLAFG